MTSGHDHSHGGAAAIRAGARHSRRLAASLAVIAVVLVVEVIVGLVSGSLALLSDAGHMATDVLGLSMALAAIHLANRGTRRRSHSFGLYRLEILGALANAALLVGVAAYVLWEAVSRLGDPPEVSSGPVIVAAAVSLAANVFAFVLLKPGAQESLNVEAPTSRCSLTSSDQSPFSLEPQRSQSPVGCGSTRSSPPLSAFGSCPTPSASLDERYGCLYKPRRSVST